MAEPATVTCKFCLGNIKQEVKFNDLVLNSILEFPTDDVLSITENPVACEKCRVDIEKMHQLYIQNEHIVIKEEIKQEDIVEMEEIVADKYVLFNTDLPLFIEESVSGNILYCYQCNYGTNDKQNLTKHIFSHCFKCDWCNYTTHDNIVLKNHQQIHKHSEPLRCNICNYTCTEMDLLVAHIATHTAANTEIKYQQPLQTSEDLFECHDCGYKTNCKNILKIHTRTCLNGQKTLLKHHQNEMIHSKYSIHSGKRSFSCDQCEYNSYCKGKLKRHKIVHSEERPYTCNLCDYTSKRIDVLKQHMKMHFGERSFSCDQCKYKTYRKETLIRHKTVHSEERPYTCNLCDFTSKYARNLKQHMKMHFGERSFSCDQCEYKTYSNGMLKSHKKVHSLYMQFM